MRRAFGQLLSLVEACALLHQFQRRIDSDGCIEAGPDDYALARELMLPPLNRTVGQRFSEPARRFFGRLRSRFEPGAVFTMTDLGKTEAVSDTAVRGWLKELAAVGLAEQVEPRKGQRPAKWKITDDAKCPDGPAADLLPPVEIVFPHVHFGGSDGPKPIAEQQVLSEVDGPSDKLRTASLSDCQNLSEESVTSDGTPEGTLT
jgi:hypothetical protein